MQRHSSPWSRKGVAQAAQLASAKQSRGMHLRATAMRGSSATSQATVQHPDAGPVGGKAKHRVVLVGIGKV